MVTDQ